MKIINKSAFSLIEVLIFITILSLFFTAASYIAASTLRNMKINQHRIIANRYAEELQAWLKSKQETDWNSFTGQINTGTDVYCFNSALNYDLTNFDYGWTAETSSPCPNEFQSLSPAIFDRKANLTDVTPAGSSCTATICQIKVDITVRWKDLGNIYTVPVSTIYSVWEQ